MQYSSKSVMQFSCRSPLLATVGYQVPRGFPTSTVAAGSQADLSEQRDDLGQLPCRRDRVGRGIPHANHGDAQLCVRLHVPEEPVRVLDGIGAALNGLLDGG